MLGLRELAVSGRTAGAWPRLPGLVGGSEMLEARRS